MKEKIQLIIVLTFITFCLFIHCTDVEAQETKRIVTHRTPVVFVGAAFDGGNLTVRVRDIPRVDDEIYLGPTMGYFKVIRVVFDVTDEKDAKIYVHLLPELVRGDVPNPDEPL